MKRSILALVAPSLVLAVTAPAPAVLEPNPWLGRKVLNIAHRGGAAEAPEETLYALKRALTKGVDVLEFDVLASADGHIVLNHDADVSRTTNGSGSVEGKTLEQLKALDAAHWYAAGRGATRNASPNEYVYRGIAMGHVAPPAGFDANDFRIATLREVLETFPGVPINIEIKAYAPTTTRPYEAALAALLKEFGRTVSDTIVVSFVDSATESFALHAAAIGLNVGLATGTAETAAFWASAQGPAPGAPNPRYHALQVPLTFAGATVLSPGFAERARANGLAVHVWSPDNEAFWREAVGVHEVDGIMTDHPGALETVLQDLGVAYP